MSTELVVGHGNPLHEIKDKPKGERLEIARKLLKSLESELTQEMADTLLTGASEAKHRNLQDVVLGALLQEGRNTDTTHQENNEILSHPPATGGGPTANQDQAPAQAPAETSHSEDKPVSVTVMNDQPSVCVPQSVTMSVEAKAMEKDSKEIASILQALKAHGKGSNNDLSKSGDAAATQGGGVFANDELTAASALQQATLLSSANHFTTVAMCAAPGQLKSDVAAKKGSSMPSGAVLTERDVLDIFLQRPKRAVDHNGLNTFAPDAEAKPTLLAEKYKVASKTIRDIWNRNTWIKLTKPYWNPEELAAVGELPADTKGLIPAQTRKRGRPCGTKDAVPRTRSCRKKVSGSDGEDASDDAARPGPRRNVKGGRRAAYRDGHGDAAGDRPRTNAEVLCGTAGPVKPDPANNNNLKPGGAVNLNAQVAGAAGLPVGVDMQGLLAASAQQVLPWGLPLQFMSGPMSVPVAGYPAAAAAAQGLNFIPFSPELCQWNPYAFPPGSVPLQLGHAPMQLGHAPAAMQLPMSSVPVSAAAAMHGVPVSFAFQPAAAGPAPVTAEGADNR